jgi:hypothetical protein
MNAAFQLQNLFSVRSTSFFLIFHPTRRVEDSGGGVINWMADKNAKSKKKDFMS